MSKLHPPTHIAAYRYKVYSVFSHIYKIEIEKYVNCGVAVKIGIGEKLSEHKGESKFDILKFSLFQWVALLFLYIQIV